MTPDVLARILRALEALEDGDTDFAIQILLELIEDSRREKDAA